MSDMASCLDVINYQIPNITQHRCHFLYLSFYEMVMQLNIVASKIYLPFIIFFMYLLADVFLSDKVRRIVAKHSHTR